MAADDDPNINPIWDAFMGDNTNTGLLRLIAGLLVFFVVGAFLSIIFI